MGELNIFKKSASIHLLFGFFMKYNIKPMINNRKLIQYDAFTNFKNN